MQIQLTGRNIEITDAIKTLTAKKFQVLHDHFNFISQIHVIFHKENISHFAEATLRANGKDFFAEAHDNDLYKAIDLLIEKLNAQISKYKGKLIDQHHHR